VCRYTLEGIVALWNILLGNFDDDADLRKAERRYSVSRQLIEFYHD
jgi:hypothetical protein